MTPQETAAYVKQKFVLPKGANVTIKGDAIFVGNADICFVLRGNMLETEELVDNIVNSSLQSLEGAMKEVASQKAAAIQAEQDIKQLLISSKKRKSPLIRK